MMTGFDESVTTDEIIAAITETGNCSPKEVRVGKIIPTRSGLYTTWILCRWWLFEQLRKVTDYD